ncbi:TetR/AcrR family transcriptional regulator [Desulfovibrio sp. TomC]|uniref:TetR/AcrR family transcriptional regulator n=1 Tax=Desulfovibrio sp. TomC TaxID=1562888 RepID=UPI000574A7D0|nr:TetR/AcrR family transcriptional regulator [Desulfovibrio sp. TomC]KHK02435.1 Transcriptional regulator, TetR family [Desulfovibrio sp. TomC]
MGAACAKRQPGRPRSDAVRSAVLEAANSLLTEVGFSGLTMEGIAARAGVGKATLYRWWPGKGAVAMEAFLAAVSPKIAFPQTDSAVADITTQMLRLAEAYRGTTGRVVCEFIALGQADPEILTAFLEGYMYPRRDAAKEVLRRGMATGEIRADVDPDLMADALYGPIFHRMLLRHRPLDDAFVQQLAALVFAGLTRS